MRLKTHTRIAICGIERNHQGSSDRTYPTKGNTEFLRFELLGMPHFHHVLKYNLL